MAAAVDDPAAPTIYRVSGAPPFPDPAFPSLPPDIVPRQVTLRDRQTVATIVPVSSRHQVPRTLLAYLCAQFNKEIEGGDTYPFIETFTVDSFADYWFQNFGGVMLLGDASVLLEEQEDWTRACLGSFFIKPNYPGRSSHVCNGGLLVTDASRNRGVGRLMGESYIDWAPRLGYTYSVFNCVYETNVASCKIWDALGFKRIGRVKGCGNLKSHPDRFVDGIIYGRDLSPSDDAEGLVTEERFDKIKFYLKFNKYPAGADRAEKSRLRSAATHYKLLDGDRLMLKDKEVISDPERQYEIARQVHMASHAGINKTTATIAEKYHWSRIKETVSDAIRACAKCKEGGTASKQPITTVPSSRTQQQPQQQQPQQQPMPQMAPPTTSAPQQQQPQQQQQTTASVLDDLQMLPAGSYANLSDLSALQHHHHQLLHGSNDAVYQPIDPQIIDASHHHFDAYHSHADFQALLTATEDVPGGGDSSAVDRDLEMLIEQHQDHDMVADEQSDDDQDMHGKDRGLYDVTFGGGGGGGGNH